MSLTFNGPGRCPNCDQSYSSDPEVDSDLRMRFRQESIQRKMALEDARNNTKKLKHDFLGVIESRLSAMIDDVVDTLHKSEHPEGALMMSDPSMMKDKRKASIDGNLPLKEFRSRPSPLTELLQVPHIRTIHHIFVAALCLVMMHTIFSDIIKTNTVDLGFERLMWTFGQPLRTLGILIPMESLALFLLYPAFYYWSTGRLDHSPGTRKMIDYGALGGFITFLVGFMYLPARAILVDPLPPASGAVVTMEQCRLLMKMYAFVRSNVPRALMFDHKNETEIANTNSRIGRHEDENENESTDPTAPVIRKRVHESDGSRGSSSPIRVNEKRVLRKRESWISWDDEKSPCPSYSRYLYFYFAPTLIYKDQYPRTSTTRWDYVCWNFAQVFGCIFYANMVMGKAVSAYFGNFGLPDHPKITPAAFCDAFFSLMLPGIFGLLLGFFLLLHAWHNAFAEMLRFGDRLFYKDWWNRSSFSDYYKTWNVLVHDWLYTYIFKDAWESGLGQRNRALPTTLVFVISSIFHEYILALSLNFFLPVLFVLFGGLGFALVFVRNNRGPLGNIFMWFGLMAGTGLILAAYAMEFYARINCPATTDSPFLNFFIPRSLYCNAFDWSE